MAEQTISISSVIKAESEKRKEIEGRCHSKVEGMGVESGWEKDCDRGGSHQIEKKRGVQVVEDECWDGKRI